VSAPLFRTGAIVALAAVAFAATGLAAFLFAYGDDVLEPITAGANTYSFSAIGHRAAMEFFRESGVPAVRNVDPRIGALDADSVLVLAEPLKGPSAVELAKRLIAKADARGRPTIVVLPKWSHRPWPMDPRWAESVAIAGAKEAEAVAAAAAGVEGTPFAIKIDQGRPATYVAETAWGASYDIRLQQSQLLAPHDGLTPVLSCVDGLLVASVAREGKPPLLIVTDPDVLNNQGLAKGDNAAFLLDLLQHVEGARKLVFDETIHGFVKRGEIVGALLRPPAVTLTAQILLLGAVIVWAFAGRFGTPRERSATRTVGRDVFIATTARLMTGSVEEGSVVERYWRFTVDEVASALRLPAGDDETRLGRLRELSSARGASDDPGELAGEVADVSRGKPRPDRWIDVALRIHRWRRELLHGPR